MTEPTADLATNRARGLKPSTATTWVPASAARGERLVVVASAVAALLWSAWRIRLGADMSDGGYAVALQLRVARGDLPFADEMNAQVLGALPGVPFVWLWHHLFGLSGVVLAARGWFVVLAFGASALAYRGLRHAFRPVVCLATVAVPSLAMPYSLPVVSYNTVPVLAVVVAASALVAAVVSSSLRWAAIAGVAIGVGAVCSPQLLPGALLFVVVATLWCSRRQARLLAGWAAAPLVLAGLWVVVVPGIDAVRRSGAWMRETQTERRSYADRLGANLDSLSGLLVSPGLLVLLVLGLAIAVALAIGPLRRPWAAALALLPAASMLPVLWFASAGVRSHTDVMRQAGTPASVGHGLAAVTAVLLVPAGVLLVRRRSRPSLVLASVGIPVSACMTVVLALSTSSGPQRGVAGAGLTVLAMAVIATCAEAAAESVPRLAAVGSVAVAVTMAGLLSLLVFPGIPPDELTETVSSGAFAGTVARPGDVAGLIAATDRLSGGRPDDGLLAVSYPGAYLLTERRADTPALWLAFWGQSNSFMTQWFHRTGREPDLVIVAGVDADQLERSRKLSRDPLARYLRRGYLPTDRDLPLILAPRQ